MQNKSQALQMDVSDSLLYERVNVSMIQPEYSKIKTVKISAAGNNNK